MVEPVTILAGIKQFGLAPDGADLRDLEAVLADRERQIAELRAELDANRKGRKHYKSLHEAAEADKARLSEALAEIAEGCTGRVDKDHLTCRIARAALSGSGAGGWRLVPIELTDEMLRELQRGEQEGYRAIWLDLLAAAPTATGGR